MTTTKFTRIIVLFLGALFFSPVGGVWAQGISGFTMLQVENDPNLMFIAKNMLRDNGYDKSLSYQLASCRSAPASDACELDMVAALVSGYEEGNGRDFYANYWFLTKEVDSFTDESIITAHVYSGVNMEDPTFRWDIEDAPKLTISCRDSSLLEVSIFWGKTVGSGRATTPVEHRTDTNAVQTTEWLRKPQNLETSYTEDILPFVDSLIAGQRFRARVRNVFEKPYMGDFNLQRMSAILPIVLDDCGV